MFISNERVPVSLTNEKGETNTIFIRSKMNVEVKNAVAGRAAQVNVNGKGPGVTVDTGSYLTALLVLNVQGWEGPAFVIKGKDGAPDTLIPCTEENIKNLDPDEPLVEKVLEEIAARNPQGKPDPNSEATGSNGSKGHEKSRRGSTAST